MPVLWLRNDSRDAQIGSVNQCPRADTAVCTGDAQIHSKMCITNLV